MELLRHRSSIIVHYWQGTDHALVKMMMINYDPHIVYEKKIVVLSTKYAGAGCRPRHSLLLLSSTNSTSWFESYVHSRAYLLFVA